MVIAERERSRSFWVSHCEPRAPQRLESIGTHSFSDLRGHDPWKQMHATNLQAGRPTCQALLAVQALESLVDAAEQAGTRIRAS